MHSTRQQALQCQAFEPRVITQDKVTSLTLLIHASIRLTQRALLMRYQNLDQISALTLLSHKSEALELHRAVLNTGMGDSEKHILISYINQNIEVIDEAIGSSSTKKRKFI
ncbi:hypothetical protein [Shewanella sp. 0m-4]